MSNRRIIGRHYLARWPSKPTPEETAEAVQAWIEAQPAPTTRTRALTAMLKARGLWGEPPKPQADVSAEREEVDDG